MDLMALVQQQIAADRRRGFPVDFVTDTQRHEQLTNDLVGLFGEIGEFANLLKKVQIKLTHPAYVGPSLDEASAALQEELADALIYIFRLSTVLGGDLEGSLTAKMKFNDERYGPLER